MTHLSACIWVQTLHSSSPLWVAELKKQAVPIQTKPQTSNQVAKDDLKDLALPCDVCLVRNSRRNEEADAAPQLPCIHPEWQALPFPSGEGKVPCITGGVACMIHAVAQQSLLYPAHLEQTNRYYTSSAIPGQCGGREHAPGDMSACSS